jgi:hypothetical protein
MNADDGRVREFSMHQYQYQSCTPDKAAEATVKNWIDHANITGASTFLSSRMLDKRETDRTVVPQAGSTLSRFNRQQLRLLGQT